MNLYLAGTTASTTTTTSSAAAASTSSAYVSAGCYTDLPSYRTLQSASYSDDSMTVESCAAYCAGWAWFGVEYGREVSRISSMSHVIH